MRPQTIGRVLGIGVRVAGRMAGQRVAANPQSPPSSGNTIAQPVTIHAVPGSAARASSRTAGRATANVARGVGGFLRPFRRVGNIVFLEIVGAFFFLFVIGFGSWTWRLRDQAARGPDHTRFLVYAAMTLLFLYLSVSSFWRAKRK